MDTSKCVVTRRDKIVQDDQDSPYSDGTDYYKIWGLSGYMGMQKYRDGKGY